MSINVGAITGLECPFSTELPDDMSLVDDDIGHKAIGTASQSVIVTVTQRAATRHDAAA
jgi:hypothetical protein